MQFEGAFLLFWSQLDAAQQALVQHPVLNEAMYQADALLYPFLLTQLSERILLSTTADEANTRDSDRTAPVDLTKLVHISRNLEEWTLAAFESYPDGFADCRVELASRTAHLLGRFAGVARLVRDTELYMLRNQHTDLFLCICIRLRHWVVFYKNQNQSIH